MLFLTPIPDLLIFHSALLPMKTFILFIFWVEMKNFVDINQFSDGMARHVS